MREKLKFEVYGIPPNEETAVFEKKLPLLNIDILMPIMGWKTDAEAVESYQLTDNQIVAIERLAGCVLPKDLDLFLSCYV